MNEGITAELEQAYFSSIKRIKEGEIVKGKIVEVNPKDVVVDIGFKSEGVIPKDEFPAQSELKEGQEIEVLVEAVEDEEGRLSLSFQKAKKIKGWKTLISDYQEGDIVEGTVTKRVKGGFMVDVFGVEGFLPGSLSAFKNVPEEEIINHKFNFQIIKLSRLKQNFILSRREALRIERQNLKKKLWDSLKIGEIRKGVVRSITDFGAFIDIGGLVGLLHIADMSWKKINHPSEVVAVGSEIEVMVLNFDRESEKISLGLKQLVPDPWLEIENKYKVGAVTKGKVVNILNYGVFVELERGIEGLIHVSELSWSKAYVNPQEMFAIGDMVEVKIIGIDSRNRKIALSIRQLEKDPWEELGVKIKPQSRIKGRVTGFTQEGALVELEGGVEGIVYTRDLSWTKRINRPQEILRKNHNYEFMVLDIDRSNRRVVLGMKQLRDNPWPEIIRRYPVGSIAEAEVIKITDFGVFAKLEEEVEGLIFNEELNSGQKESLSLGQRIKVKILRVDDKGAKIALSAKVDESPTSESSD
ncbi:MAG: 30S ribosomal protein S1 [Candidatus Omnitrophica bacterium]|nr:30S ribosomal protein S1 [Candidatus Omnitrophota bacterium]